jgi:hypothetical protein
MAFKRLFLGVTTVLISGLTYYSYLIPFAMIILSFIYESSF